MTVSESDRLTMLAGLQTHLGGFVADTLMEHLPHGGWHDLARTADIDRLHEEMIAMRRELRDELRGDLQVLSGRLDSATRWIIGIALTSTVSIMGTLVAVLVTLLNQQ